MKKLNWLCFIGYFLLVACSGGDNEPEVPTPPEPKPPVQAEKIPINLSLGMVDTRATDTSFETSDRVGLYVVNYANGNAGTLQTTGNHVDNMKLTYTNGIWNPDTPLFWKDETTKADFYCFYPYAAVTNVQQYAFALKENQSTLANYSASDFLWGKTSGISPTEAAVNIRMRHIFSNIIIKVEPGEGFTSESLAAADVSVRMGQIKSGASIDLTTGTATATGTAGTLVPLKEEGGYRALVVPQTVMADDFITVTVDGRDYTLAKEFTFKANTQHPFTVKVTRTSNGINVGIGSWDEDDTDHGGIAE